MPTDPRRPRTVRVVRSDGSTIYRRPPRKRRRRGRKRAPGFERMRDGSRHEGVRVRLTPDELDAISAAASRSSVTCAAFLRAGGLKLAAEILAGSRVPDALPAAPPIQANNREILPPDPEISTPENTCRANEFNR